MIKPLIFMFGFLAFMPLASAEEARQEKEPVCEVVAQYKDGDSAKYVEGVDVYGRPVVPATLNSNNFQVPDVIKVPLDINLAQRMNAVADGVQLEAPLGMLQIHNDGRVVYNDQDWTAPIMTLCGESHKVVEEVLVTNTPAQEVVDDRQAAEDVIKSDPVMQVEEVLEVQPTQTIPPNEVNIGQIEVDPPVQDDVVEESDIIEGGEYREIYYNE